MQMTSRDSVLLQVVIGGINVDFIAKGKTQTLRVSTLLLKISVLNCARANSHLLVPFSLGRPTREVCSSHLEALVATSPVRFYTITSHVNYITLGLNVPTCFCQDSLSRLGQRPLLISATGADSSSDAVFKHCQHMVSQRQRLKVIIFRYVSLPFLSEHERRGQAQAAEHRHLLLHCV